MGGISDERNEGSTQHALSVPKDYPATGLVVQVKDLFEEECSDDFSI